MTYNQFSKYLLVFLLRSLGMLIVFVGVEIGLLTFHFVNRAGMNTIAIALFIACAGLFWIVLFPERFKSKRI